MHTYVHACGSLNLQFSGGFAFSQEEHGTVSQAEVIRAYDSTKAKPEGN